MKNRISLIASLALLLGSFYAQGQAPERYSLQQSIDYALQNRASLKATRNEENIARARVGEIRAAGLPQINGSLDVGDNFIQQQSFLPAEFFQDPNNPNAPEPGTFVPVTFTPAYTANATVTASQMLFDGAYLIGLKAANTYKELSRKTTQQSEIEVAEQVSKAYYGVLVNRERMELLEQNLVRLDTLLTQTAIMFENGVAEKLDVDRLRVQLNNLKVEKQKTVRLMELSENLLKFQMGVEQAQLIELTDELEEVEVDMSKLAPRNFNYSDRIEYSILETQRDLAELDLRNRKAGYLPKLFLNSRYGYLAAGNEFGQVSNLNNWLEFGYVGGQLQVPIFDGLRKHYQIQQAKLALENTKFGFETLRQSIDLELEQASAELTNALDMLDAQRENLELAAEIARVAKIKFQEGVGSNLEVVNAETDLREAQTNYYAAMYDALIAKVNLEKATGTLQAK
ncbi:outer membrane protein TolC [Pontibacter ummariensis]|uniref:Outer membrane protein TolC n=1 Tax=Pontibacter ummariensis TaxID=1610492 RepID=A0A239L1I4_9BACT|nr:TolC family protein [Pontibacter ummariensis]PRY04611.1 outer membrane protein TolC [Pontibacter ummariensis]SNT24160.1 Outer membrane protein TolC [Pontibacter ummariensis]